MDEPPRALLGLPDGRTVEVHVLLQQRVGDRWRCQVRWTEGVGATFYQGRGGAAPTDSSIAALLRCLGAG